MGILGDIFFFLLVLRLNCMVVKPIRRYAKRWQRQIKRMWGISVRPQITQDYQRMLFLSGKSKTPPKGKRKSQKISEPVPPLDALPEEFEPPLARAFQRKTPKGKGMGSKYGVYVHPKPQIWYRNESEVVTDDLNKAENRAHTVPFNLAHELGHVIGFEKNNEMLSLFLAHVSEWEYALRHDPAIFRYWIKPKVRRNIDPKRFSGRFSYPIFSSEIGHREVNFICHRFFRHFPQARERNRIVREIIARNFSTAKEINHFLWQEIRKQKLK